MRLTAVTRVFNEEDIIEPFIRHHATFAQSHILLDNGSGDRTLDILAALRREGFDLAVHQNTSPVFVEPIYNTALLGAALELGAPDWVLFLDCDEFIDDRAAPGGLAAALSNVPPGVAAVQVPVMDYVAATDETMHALNCVERLVFRKRALEPHHKIFVRRPTGEEHLSVSAGAHFLLRDNRLAPSLELQGVRLGHFPERSALQVAAKAIIGRLKVMATGNEGATLQWSAQYAGVFAALRDDPVTWLDEAEMRIARPAVAGPLVHDPLPYRGGKLAFTLAADPRRHAISAILRHAENLATGYGRLIDGSPGTGGQVVMDASSFVKLL